jgi:hypothetical protein
VFEHVKVYEGGLCFYLTLLITFDSMSLGKLGKLLLVYILLHGYTIQHMLRALELLENMENSKNTGK